MMSSKVMQLSVWASARDVPNRVCFDARLGGGNAKSDPRAQFKGHAGWHVGINFSNAEDLARQLHTAPIATPRHVCGNWILNCPPIREGQVERLGINVHGIAGEVFINGQANRPGIRADNIDQFRPHLEGIGRATHEKAVILIMGCLAGQLADGTRLLQALSLVWPGRQVVAFVNVGYGPAGRMKRMGEACTEPGMRDTGSTMGSMGEVMERQRYDGLWEDLARMPWAWEGLPSAKVARNGQILRAPAGGL